MVILFLGIIRPIALNLTKRQRKRFQAQVHGYKNIASVHTIPIAIVMFFIFICWSLYNVYIVEYAKELNIQGISAFFTVLAVVLMIIRPFSGWITDRLGLAKVLPPALILFAASFIMIGTGRTIGQQLFGSYRCIGFGSFQPALYSMCILSETPLKRSVASNTLYIGIDLGLFIGPLFGSVVYEMYSYSTMFKTGAFIAILAMIVFIMLLPAYYKRRRVLESMEISRK
jgi:MFS family permease